ncbi:hypothetical protein DENSPDRAFT_886010 [Dentipellis sp. KUC8613]|nr:hypothetical protein DENSPDRAFT_886010 [Dentipellis sp. KUC8613]
MQQACLGVPRALATARRTPHTPAHLHIAPLALTPPHSPSRRPTCPRNDAAGMSWGVMRPSNGVSRALAPPFIFTLPCSPSGHPTRPILQTVCSSPPLAYHHTIFVPRVISYPVPLSACPPAVCVPCAALSTSCHALFAPHTADSCSTPPSARFSPHLCVLSARCNAPLARHRLPAPRPPSVRPNPPSSHGAVHSPFCPFRYPWALLRPAPPSLNGMLRPVARRGALSILPSPTRALRAPWAILCTRPFCTPPRCLRATTLFLRPAPPSRAARCPLVSITALLCPSPPSRLPRTLWCPPPPSPPAAALINPTTAIMHPVPPSQAAAGLARPHAASPQPSHAPCRRLLPTQVYHIVSRALVRRRHRRHCRTPHLRSRVMSLRCHLASGRPHLSLFAVTCPHVPPCALAHAPSAVMWPNSAQCPRHPPPCSCQALPSLVAMLAPPSDTASRLIDPGRSPSDRCAPHRHRRCLAHLYHPHTPLCSRPTPPHHCHVLPSAATQPNCAILRLHTTTSQLVALSHRSWPHLTFGRPRTATMHACPVAMHPCAK